MSNDTTKDAAKKLRDDAHDTVDEAKQRAQAAGEKLTRSVRGDDMPLGERIVSNIKEAGHTISAEVDKAKRDARHAGDDKDTTA